MSRPMLLEVIALNAADAAAAEAGGADRLELVTDMAADGLTPSRETVAAVRAAVEIPVRVMLRAEDGFAAGDAEALAARARALRAEGAEEFVLGFLDEAGGPDLATVGRLLEAVGDGCRWTFHRAIDRAADRDTLRKQLAGLPGLDTYLTAGSAKGVADGLAVLVAEAARATARQPGYEARIMAGGGLTTAHVPRLRAAGLDAFHVGGAVRPEGWSGPVSPRSVAEWRTLLDT
ncbi:MULTISPECIES: copper homeostasis protein CutC [unclassified Streptomyces]|uniref:copper homeostasis protein CutC n=1 Tax=unclassified Streptomyces TaxID=2593676 RepID=UPI000B1FD2DF|nr:MULTISPECIES: copper homeostasis protein CutC [unclassified Streptomyces]